MHGKSGLFQDELYHREARMAKLMCKAPYPLKLPAGRFRVLPAPGATFLNREHAGDAAGSIQYVGLHREAGTLAGGNFLFFKFFS